MFTLLFWGLPSSRIDPLLFGGDPPWPPERYGAAGIASELRGRQAGADVDRDPIEDRDKILDLTGSQKDVAAIMTRYRLFSRQPDEMITFRALQQMDPRHGDLDPRLYQYGGAYIYLVGAALGAAHVLGLAHITSDVDYYLTNPDAFGRFYVVARVLSLLAGGLLLVGVFRLAASVAGRVAGWVALILTACAPVFISGALEAKPHILSAAALVWAAYASLRYLRRPTTGRMVLAASLAGLSFAFVLTGLVAVLLIPAAVVAVARPRRRSAHLAWGLVVFALVYTATNPYPVHHVLFDRAALMANIGNSTSMYSVARFGAGLLRVLVLLFESGGLFPFLGLIAAIVLAVRRPRESAVVALPILALLAICVAIGAGKPAEFARFLVAPVAVAAVPLAIWIRRSLARGRFAAALMLAGCAATLQTPAYVGSFAADCGLTGESRYRAAEYLAAEVPSGAAIGVVQEPAPYCVPPLDFAHRRVVLLPQSRPASSRLPEYLVLTADDRSDIEGRWWKPDYRLEREFGGTERRLSRVTWADKPVLVFRLGASDN